jgi:cytochrome c6
VTPRWSAAIIAAVALAAGACGDDGGGSDVDGKNVFLSAGCGSCHTLADAGTTGAVGPNLDELKPNALKVEVFVTDGSPPNMPSFKDQLSEDEIKAVAEYVSEATGGNE